ncbi:MAG: patatin-like phospholipase family protein [Clostridia bacterium]|nr:patatin-like phospholipase family protein [Clostridia bacterium]
MKLTIDPSLTYAVALEGGGARGAWQVGVWKALEEAGIKYTAVSGTSVGALNGAFMAMRRLEEAERLWTEVNYSKVMKVNDDDMRKIMQGHVLDVEFDRVFKNAYSVIRDKGFDITPLREMLRNVVDEKAVRESDVRYFIITYCITDRESLELEASKLPEGTISDMMLASAYLPIFKHIPLGGKYYADGAVKDTIPIHVLTENSYRNILAIRLRYIGVERKFRLPKDTHITTFEPSTNLGNILEFEGEHASDLIRLGYYDAKRVLYGLVGHRYYVERTMKEIDAYVALSRMVEQYCKARKKDYSLRSLHENYIPRLAQQVSPFGDYYDVYLAFLERCAEKLSLELFKLRTDRELAEEVREAALKTRRTGLLKYFLEDEEKAPPLPAGRKEKDPK